MVDYKQKAVMNKKKIIKKDVNKFKKICIKEFKQNIKRGLNQTIVDFLSKISSEFEEEISDIVLKELRQDNPYISFEFSWRHCNNSYKGIQMDAN